MVRRVKRDREVSVFREFRGVTGYREVNRFKEVGDVQGRSYK